MPSFFPERKMKIWSTHGLCFDLGEHTTEAVLARLIQKKRMSNLLAITGHAHANMWQEPEPRSHLEPLSCQSLESAGQHQVLSGGSER
jgi:hypothetical protein